MLRFTSRCVTSVLFVLTVFTSIVSAAAPPGRLKVTATIFPLADIVRQVGGNRVHVVTLLRPGALPFSYQPSQMQIRQTVGTSLYLRVGGSFDLWGDNLFSTDAAEKPLVITATELVNQLLEDKAKGGADSSRPGHNDPWVWLDPRIVRDRILPAVSAALIRLRPGDARFFKVNERKYFEELTKLDQTMWSVIQRLPGKGFIATHPVWGYLAKRYGLLQAADTEPLFAEGPKYQNLDSLVATAQKLGIVAVFGDPWSNVNSARVLAERIQGRFVMLDPLGGEQLPGRHNYIALMNYNLAQIMNEIFAVNNGESL